MLITLENCTKYHNEKCILKNVSLSLEEKKKTALVGINGAGKSTLLKILAGAETIDEGKILRKKDLRLAYLPQNPVFDESLTIFETIQKVNDHAEEYEMKSILTRLGFSDLNLPISVLSGGQRKRVALAQALLKPCDLLILDEPTNHLDNEMVAWLEKTLQKMNAGILMVTHDRYFLERITNKIIEIDQGSLYAVEGNYSDFLQAKMEREEIMLASERKRKNLLRKELEWIRAGVQARGTKSKDRIARFEALNAVEDIAAKQNLQLDTLSSRLGKKIMEIEHLSKRYGDHLLFENFSYHVKHHDRIGILGHNGCGKTTLMNILAGLIEPDSGQVILGDTVKIGYYRQNDEDLDLNERVIDCIRLENNEIKTQEGTFNAAMMLERFLFPSSMHYTPINRLSGGERKRLYLLKVLMNQPNVLFLDEPTNDLDIQTLQVLEDYLDSFEGVVFVVSHDRYFLDRVCDSLFIFEENKTITQMIGGYSQYIELAGMNQAPKEKKEKMVIESSVSMSTKEKQELAKMDEVLEQLQNQIDAIDEEMKDCTDFKKIEELSNQRDALEKEMEIKMERWIELSEKKAQVDEIMKRKK